MIKVVELKIQSFKRKCYKKRKQSSKPWDNTMSPCISASHITIIGTILPWKNLKKVKILVSHIYVPKMDKNHLQGLKNLRKTILNVLEANLDENLIFEKQNRKIYPQIQKFSIFLKFLKLV